MRGCAVSSPAHLPHPGQQWLDFGRVAGADEALCYHQATGTDWAFFSILQRPQETYETDWGERLAVHKRRPLVQNSYPLHLLPEVVTALDPALDSYISQAEFTKPNRRAVNLWRTGVLFVDLDTYHTDWRDHPPERIRDAILHECETRGWPNPSVILCSGRGLYLKWFHTPIPRQALPRWAAIERRLVQLFASFGADQAAKDVSRVLRIVGTTNTKSGQAVRVLHVEFGEDGKPIQYDLDYLAEWFLPKSREQISQERIEREARRQEYRRRQEERLKAGKAGNLTRKTLGELNWTRLGDLQKLAEMRATQNRGRIPDGQREPLLFWQLNFMLLAHAIEPSQIWFEAQALARNLGMSGCHNSELSTLYAKAQAHRRGETVEWNGRKMPPLYTPKNQTLIDWLRIEPDEERELQTIFSEQEARRRARERDRERDAIRKPEQRRAEGRKSHYGPEIREQARRLVFEARMSTRQAARELGVSQMTIVRWCR